MTRGAAQRRLAGLFTQAGFATAALDARVLLCAALAIDHVALVRDPDAPLGPAAADLAAFAARRLAHEPVSRILGRREFWGLPFVITPAVLDPRPDTEVVVAAVLALVEGRRRDRLRLLDLGTGSGAILVALLSELPDAFGIGIDRSFEACRVAQGNLRALGLAARSAVVQGSWGEAFGRPAGGSFDIVVSNPPYIATAALSGLAPDVRDYDPALALDGGTDGLSPYRSIVPQLPDLLRPGGIAALEGGSTQSAGIAATMRAAGLADVAISHDLAGHGRVVTGRAA